MIGPRPPSSLPRSLSRPSRPSPAPIEQQLQIRLVVGIERAEDLVEVDVGRGVGRRDRVALLVLAGTGAARIELEEHVLERRRRAHQDRRVLVDRQVLALDREGHDALAVLEVDVGDVADLDAGDADRLALAGHDRLGGLELGLQLEGLLLEDRDPQALLLDDVAGDPEREDQQHEDRQEVPQVLANRGAHQPPFASFSSGASCDRGEPELLRGRADLLRRRRGEHRGRVGGRRRALLRRGADATLEVRRLLALARRVRLERGLRRVLDPRHRAEDRERGEADRVLEARPPDWLGTPFGMVTVLVPPPAATRMYWPLASPERLSPAMPSRP